MRLIIKHLVLLLLGFGLLWAVLSTIPWVRILHIKENTEASEEKIGLLLWEQISQSERVLKGSGVTQPMDDFLSRLCSQNGLEKSSFHVHVIENSEVNAFAMPGGHIVMYTGLLEEAQHEDEVIGVLAHEMSHVLLSHVMESLAAEVGITVLTNMASGGIGGETLNEMAKFLAKGAYSRSMEEEADRKAVQLLVGSGISPIPLANFLKRMTRDDEKGILNTEWLSTHPDAQIRSKNIVKWAGADTVTISPVLSKQRWQRLKVGIGLHDQTTN